MTTFFMNPKVQTGIEMSLTTGLLAQFFRDGPSQDIASHCVPFGALFSGVNAGLATVLSVHEKPKIVQVAFPFFSGLAAAALVPLLGLPTTELGEVYMVSLVLLTGAALIKVLAKSILKMAAEPKEESKPARFFNYIVAGTASFIPSGIAGLCVALLFGLEQKSEGFTMGGFAVIGVFFGLAQVCVTTLLGAPQKEGRMFHGFLPLFTSVFPFLNIGAMGGVSSPKVADEIAVITITSLLTALVGTVASRYFARQPQVEKQPAIDEKKEEQPDQRSTYRRPGFSTTLSYHSQNSGMK
ncbi:hypothetical protein [Simkania sp.]|uniref:hypothetical protein n=1 Tax=Simkania sp. TaxID=34094 RepID=UPI003B52111A